MPTEQELIDERKKKLEELRAKGINPYPYNYEQKDLAIDIKAKYVGLAPETHTEDFVQAAGRLTALRRMGKATFAVIDDFSGTIQIYLRDGVSSDYDLFKLFDIGDWIGVYGKIFATKTGELTIQTEKFTMLAKSLRPLPEKWHGLQDIEERYRKRHIDLIVNKTSRETFIKRSQIIESIRQTMLKKKFLEIETPIMQPIYGGAAAKPFVSHLNALDMKVYMRIAYELYHKRLLVGGYPKIFEISKCFRNEDIDRSHNPEFTMMEAYNAFTDLYGIMDVFEDIYVDACMKLHGSTKITYQGKELDFKKPWKRMKMVDAIKELGKVDVDSMSDDELFDFCRIEKIEIKGKQCRGNAIVGMFEELCEDKIVQPTFITHHPIESTPLCKPSREDPRYAERFEPLCCSMELGNAYTELNDPILQRKFLEEQAKQLKEGNEEANPMDEDFVQAIEQGLPPTGGFGLGVERMVMLLTDQASIRDILFFPFMKS